MPVIYENQVILGNCLEVLRELPDASFDSVVTDVPYGLGNHEPTPDEILAYLLGADLDSGGDFMGKDWQIPSVLVWREAYRVLKPGGHVLCFGGTRTFDLIAIGLRMAGFERRDTIADNHPGLEWIQSQGMPKSLNVSKAIDRAAGAKREVVGVAQHIHSRGKNTAFPKRPGEKTVEESGRTVRQDVVVVTAPATPEAASAEGYGTGLKPTWEPVLVFRKPLEGTVAENFLKHGTGALNIDGCRVKHSSPEDFEKHKAGVDAIKARGGSMKDSWKNSSDLSGANDVTSAGRWPPNLILEHAPWCRRVKNLPVPEVDPGLPEDLGKAIQTIEEGDAELGIWECVEGCPVKALNEQSGECRSAGDYPTTYSNGLGYHFTKSTQGPLYEDSGGASRFYPQFEGQAQVEVPFIYSGKANKKETTLDGQIENDHPTKKPLKVMQWLVRLVTPKGGITLDPYCGSGSTLHAAVEEGMRFTGIERDPHSHEIATKRMNIVVEEAENRRYEKELFELAMGGGDL
jgi:site-specific DNA-methyltransferase (adenine-specific)